MLNLAAVRAMAAVRCVDFEHCAPRSTHLSPRFLESLSVVDLSPETDPVRTSQLSTYMFRLILFSVAYRIDELSLDGF